MNIIAEILFKRMSMLFAVQTSGAEGRKLYVDIYYEQKFKQRA